MSVRPASESDVEQIVKIWSDAYWDQGPDTATLPPAFAAERTGTSAFDWRVQKHLQCFLVACDSHTGAVVGFTMVSQEELEVTQLYLSAHARGSGLGGALLAAAEQRLAEGAGVAACTVSLTVFEQNMRARRFYEKSGWRCCGVHTHEVEVSGGRTFPLALVRYEKPLGVAPPPPTPPPSPPPPVPPHSPPPLTAPPFEWLRTGAGCALLVRGAMSEEEQAREYEGLCLPVRFSAEYRLLSSGAPQPADHPWPLCLWRHPFSGESNVREEPATLNWGRRLMCQLASSVKEELEERSSGEGQRRQRPWEGVEVAAAALFGEQLASACLGSLVAQLYTLEGCLREHVDQGLTGLGACSRSALCALRMLTNVPPHPPLHPPCTHPAPILHPCCIPPAPPAPTLHPPCTHPAPTLHSPCTHLHQSCTNPASAPPTLPHQHPAPSPLQSRPAHPPPITFPTRPLSTPFLPRTTPGVSLSLGATSTFDLAGVHIDVRSGDALIADFGRLPHRLVAIHPIETAPKWWAQLNCAHGSTPFGTHDPTGVTTFGRSRCNVLLRDSAALGPAVECTDCPSAAAALAAWMSRLPADMHPGICGSDMTATAIEQLQEWPHDWSEVD